MSQFYAYWKDNFAINKISRQIGPFDWLENILVYIYHSLCVYSTLCKSHHFVVSISDCKICLYKYNIICCFE